jgi:hypothetical protein
LAEPIQKEIEALGDLPDNMEIASCVLTCPSKEGFVSGGGVKKRRKLFIFDAER